MLLLLVVLLVLVVLVFLALIVLLAVLLVFLGVFFSLSLLELVLPVCSLSTALTYGAVGKGVFDFVSIISKTWRRHFSRTFDQPTSSMSRRYVFPMTGCNFMLQSFSMRAVSKPCLAYTVKGRYLPLVPDSVRSNNEFVKVSVMAFFKPCASVGVSFQNAVCSASDKATKSGSGKVPKIRVSMTCLLEHDPHCHTAGVLRISLVPGFTVSTIILHLLQVGVPRGNVGSMTPAVVKGLAALAALFIVLPEMSLQKAGIP